MSHWMILFLLLMILFLTLAWIKKKAGESPADFPYQSKDVLCSPAERSFLCAMDEIVGKNYRIFAKVRLADIIEVQKGVSASLRQRAFNRIAGKQIDFVVCNATDLSILGAIELDDKTHRGKGRQERDRFLDKTLEAAGVPVLRIKAQSAYSIEEIAGSLDSAFNMSVGAQLEDNHVSMDTQAVSDEKFKDVKTEDLDTEFNVPVCPKCGKELVKRIATKGQYAGQKFWGCSNFPKCKFTKTAEQAMGLPPESSFDP
ncbi:MAG: DUF2726 domain-containing protein [Deltaproteobacteria bacterium]|nr:DUF2726 domain-containing protein [Deltaproteobacteria bacterium]